MKMNKEYNLLRKVDEVDIEAVRQYAEARTERGIVEKRFSELDDLIDENEHLREHVWTTQAGECKAIKDIDDEHLLNIRKHLSKTGGHNYMIDEEYKKRFGNRFGGDTWCSSDTAPIDIMSYLEEYGY